MNFDKILNSSPRSPQPPQTKEASSQLGNLYRKINVAEIVNNDNGAQVPSLSSPHATEFPKPPSDAPYSSPHDTRQSQSTQQSQGHSQYRSSVDLLINHDWDSDVETDNASSDYRRRSSAAPIDSIISHEDEDTSFKDKRADSSKPDQAFSSPILVKAEIPPSLVKNTDSQNASDAAPPETPPSEKRQKRKETQSPTQVETPSSVQEQEPSSPVQPKRYSVMPIWARSWRRRFEFLKPDGKYDTSNKTPFYTEKGVPLFTTSPRHNSIGGPRQQQQQQQQNYSRNNQQNRIPITAVMGAVQNFAEDRPAFKKLVNDSGLPYSLTNTLPYEDLTRRVTSWLYAQLNDINEKNSKHLQFIEVEIKLGEIMDKKTDRRLNMPVETETMLNLEFSRSDTRFKASVDDALFSNALRFLERAARESPPEETEETKSNDKANDKSNDAPKRQHIKVLPRKKTTDRTYRVKESGENVRITFDESDKELERVSKVNHASMSIYLPGTRLDLRLSINFEIPQDPRYFQPEKKAILKTRAKDRQSFVTKGVSVDVTSVITRDQGTDGIPTKEIELEFDKDMLLDWFQSMKENGEAAGYFEELIRFNLDNARQIIRHVSFSR